jgi:diguanylate cyclase (GGDEF)-like protein
MLNWVACIKFGMTISFTSRKNLPDDVRVELVHLLYSSMLQAIILAITVTASVIAFAFKCGGLANTLIGVVAGLIAIARIVLILQFKKVSRLSMPLQEAVHWRNALGLLMILVGVCLALLVLRAAALDRLDFFILFFGIILSFCTGAATRSAVVPWIPVTTAYVMLIACMIALVRRPEFGCYFGGWFLLFMLVAYAEACLHLEGTVVDKILARRAVAWAAAHDGLTGLPNRTSFNARLEAACTRARELNEPSAVLYLDLDRFKHVNDTLGHAAGDELLQQVSKRLCQVSGVDGVFRLGGDEFAVLLERSDGPAFAQAVAARIVSEVGQPYALSSGPADVGVSVGIAAAPANGTDPSRVLNLADRALYQAKHGGRGCWAEADERTALAA